MTWFDFYLLIFGLRAFVAACGLLLQGRLLLGITGPRCGLSSWARRLQRAAAPERNLPGPGTELLSPALAGRFLPSVPPEKFWLCFSNKLICVVFRFPCE